MLRKAIICVLIIIMGTDLISAQNLVPNPSFEGGTCPDGHSQMDRVLSWYSAVGEGTSDYFNECYTPYTYLGWTYYDGDVPRNHIGYQQPRTGKAYAGCHMSSPQHGNEYREYVGVELTNELVKGTCYYFEMYVSLADSSGFAISSIGAHFSKYKLVNQGSETFITTPQVINNNGIITDTSGWVKISGNFLAQGEEKYLIIGNFAQNNLRQETGNATNSQGGVAAYYYVDDVSLIPYSYKKKLTDTLICPNTTAILDVTTTEATSYHWNYGAQEPVVSISDAGYYKVDIKLGECLFTDDITIDVFRRYDEPDRVYCNDRGESRYIDISSRGDTFLWNDSITDGNRYFDSAGQYSVIIHDQCGIYQDDIHVSFYDNCNAVVVTPSAFTPNNDGLNDGFRPILTNVSEYEFIIFNRWGEIIFRSENTGDYWDGTYKGKLCPEGAYLWVVFYGKHLKSTKPDTSKKGTVTLLH